ncbi:MAG: hypothetical protein Q4D20_01725 [Clostridia bacterium]|nr:hypothetical protein [Clostridia bacterium]
MKNASKKLLSVVLSIMMVLSAMVFSTSAVDETWTAITDESGLKAIENDLAGKYYLASDIEVGSDFLPIGWLDSGDTAFTGEFDGNGHTVSGLAIDSGSNTGLFAINEGTIKNLTVSDSKIVVSTQGGFIAGVNNESGVISNCTVSGSLIYGEFKTSTSQKYWLKSGYQVGGVAGLNKGTIEKCVNDNTDVRGWFEVGGICGRNEGTVSQCVGTGYINSTNSGIAASAQETRFKYAAEAAARFSAYTYGRAGGIAGFNGGTLENVVVRNAAGNKYIGLAGFNTVGGICGMNEGLISKACATNVQFTFPSNGAQIYYPNGKVNGYSGTVYSWSNKFFHPIAATQQNGGTTEDCLYASMKSGEIPSASFDEGGRGTSFSADSLKGEDIYKENGWDFDNVWSIDPETQLPIPKFMACNHEWSDWKVTKEATCNKYGEQTRTCSLCSATETEKIEKTAHTPAPAVKENVVAATCGKEGSYDSVVYCSVCGKELSRETVTVAKTEDHTPSEAVKENEVAATCKAEGSYDSVVYCSVCGKELSRETVTVAKTEDHTPSEAVKENEVAATCKAEGSYDSVVYCSVCGKELSRETVKTEKLAHTEEIIPAVDATCTTTGLTEGKKCSVCGEILVAQKEVPMTGHTEATREENRVEASCGADGSYDLVTYCTVCETVLKTEKETIPATGEHNYVTEVEGSRIPATCVAEGKVTMQCACGATKEITLAIDPNNHSNVVTDEAIPATCETAGKTEGKHCEACNTVIVAQKEVPMTGHTPSEAVKENEVPATCKAEGSYDSVVYCSVCKAELSRETVKTEKLAHTEEVIPAVDATCTTTGLSEGKKCSVCGEILVAQNEVPMTGHTPSEAVKENVIAATCETEGSYESVVECSVCGKELSRETVTVEKTGHTPSKAVRENVVAATCEAEGSYESVVYCSVCKAELGRETVVIPATGHSATTVVGAKEATCTEDGYTGDKVCSVCGKVAETGSVIAATGHRDSNSDGDCDVCGKLLVNCNHMCHSRSKFVKFIWLIINFFCSILKINKTCSCGIKHY